LSLLLLGCSSEAAPEIPPPEAFEKEPLLLARAHFLAGYDLVGYYEQDSNQDGLPEVLTVFTLKVPLEQSLFGDTYVMLFDQNAGLWSLTHNWQLDGVNASSELRDLDGDGLPELLIATELAASELGDFVVPYHYTDHLYVFTYEPNLSLIELGSFSSTISDATNPKTTIGEWGGQPAIQTAHDLPPTGSPLVQPYRVETFVWNGQEFVSIQMQEHKRVAPEVTWAMRRNAPWFAVSLGIGIVLGLIIIAIARRVGLQERWFLVGLIVLLIGGGIGLTTVKELLCVPVLVLISLVGLIVGRQIAVRLVAVAEHETGPSTDGST
jgi:hypothetical protein